MAKKQIKDWPKKLDAAIKQQFGRKTETTWNIIAMGYITSPTDDKPLTKKIHAFIEKWMTANVSF